MKRKFAQYLKWFVTEYLEWRRIALWQVQDPALLDSLPGRAGLRLVTPTCAAEALRRRRNGTFRAKPRDTAATGGRPLAILSPVCLPVEIRNTLLCFDVRIRETATRQVLHLFHNRWFATLLFSNSALGPVSTRWLFEAKFSTVLFHCLVGNS